MSIRAPRIEFAVGAFLLLALASLLVLALASTNGRWGLGSDTYPLTARFTSIGALRPNAPVKIGGVAIGHVAAIDVDPVKFDTVVTLAISKRYDKLPADTAASILTSGLLGESYVNLAPGGDPDPLKPGDEIYLTQSAVDLIQLVGKYMFSGGGGAGADNAATPAAPGPAEKPAGDDVPAYLQGQ
ncbi:outer membrane lipid asymmetry maintenance protein MlaD [Vulcaniibacterium tengchongense]|uniref:Phospholipid/cholesterol/gamma-HCH transport system substrate-binding protein n=1 Tax=Vulcaniibacterium tengchongense TaxID=1273429 RepID=A0A3N4W273_9GAMM|nr:outer membrane lipid asymmetry maintenance protein MlaD [Vulcaniibacterium tengchongense]RPE80170.1 phospholipid/cholesterol/gamma-HCH transport system substrate-binding protein [Vulcaniibacterium tengchongense]